MRSRAPAGPRRLWIVAVAALAAVAYFAVTSAPPDLPVRTWTRGGDRLYESPGAPRIPAWTFATKPWDDDRGTASLVVTPGRFETAIAWIREWTGVAPGTAPPSGSPVPGTNYVTGYGTGSPAPPPPSAPRVVRRHDMYRLRRTVVDGATWTEWTAPGAVAESDWDTDSAVAGTWRFGPTTYGIGGRTVVLAPDGRLLDASLADPAAAWASCEGVVRVGRSVWGTTDWFVVDDDGRRLLDLHGMEVASRVE